MVWVLLPIVIEIYLEAVFWAMKNRSSLGFTLIELMITIAILSILLTVAVPSYRAYIDKTLLLEAVNYGASLKAGVEEEYAMTGRFRNGNYVRNPVVSDVVSSYEFWAPSRWQKGDNRVVWIHVFLKPDVYPGATVQEAVIFEGKVVDGGVQWTCGAHPTTRNIPGRYLPSGCDGIIPLP